YHQGELVDRQFHFGGLVSGDDQGAHRGGDQRQSGSFGGPQGKRHHGASHPRGHRRAALLDRRNPGGRRGSGGRGGSGARGGRGNRGVTLTGRSRFRKSYGSHCNTSRKINADD